jgi:hypothetical protein
LVKYDSAIAEAAEKLRPYGEEWVTALGQAYFALREDKSYLPHIIQKLSKDAATAQARQVEAQQQEAARRWASTFSYVGNRERCNKESLDILREAEKRGYVVAIDGQGTISASKQGRGTSYFHSNEDIQRFRDFF